MSRVLLVHNRYRSAGGEETAVDRIAELLVERGHAVARLERDSGELTGPGGRARAGGAILRGGVAPGQVAAAVREHRADVVHVHNMLPLFGPRALAAARASGARVVLHLHNFRLFCSIGIAYRDGAVCHRCTGRDTRPAVALRCRDDALESAIYAAGLALHQPTVMRSVDRFVVPARDARDTLVRLGLPGARTSVLPNFLPAEAFASASRAGAGRYALYAGRLVEEKGIDTAIGAAERAGVPLRIAGAGPDERRLRALAAGGEVSFLGQLDRADLARQRAGAAFALAPSRWEEICPFAVLEALADGVPVLGSAIGGLPELLGEESTLAPGDTEAWARAMASLWSDPPARQALGERVLADARERFGADRFHAGLMEAYGATEPIAAAPA